MRDVEKTLKSTVHVASVAHVLKASSALGRGLGAVVALPPRVVVSLD